MKRFTNMSNLTFSYTTRCLFRHHPYHAFGWYGGFLGQRGFLHESGLGGFWWHGARMGRRGRADAVPLWFKRDSRQLVVLLPQLAQTQTLVLQVTLQFQHLHLRVEEWICGLVSAVSVSSLFPLYQLHDKLIDVKLQNNPGHYRSSIACVNSTLF